MSPARWRAAPSGRWWRSPPPTRCATTPKLYLNRLSDLLFVLARVLNRANLDGLGGDDVYWRSEKLQRSGEE